MFKAKNNITKEEASYLAQELNINQYALSRNITQAEENKEKQSNNKTGKDKEEKIKISDENESKPNARLEIEIQEQKMEELLKIYNGK